MAFAEHEVLIRRDAMAVYLYLLDATNLPLWRDGVRRVKLVAG
ncbi:MAG: putative integral rane protein, partial [Pseudarthrobacter sp.]|nr:putative integral rane protein [Pseudarthrobacter sp.]